MVSHENPPGIARFQQSYEIGAFIPNVGLCESVRALDILLYSRLRSCNFYSWLLRPRPDFEAAAAFAFITCGLISSTPAAARNS